MNLVEPSVTQGVPQTMLLYLEEPTVPKGEPQSTWESNQ